MSLRRRHAEVQAARTVLDAAHVRVRSTSHALGARVAAQPLPWLGGVVVGGFLLGRVRVPLPRLRTLLPLLRGQILPLATQLGTMLGERMRRTR